MAWVALLILLPPAVYTQTGTLIGELPGEMNGTFHSNDPGIANGMVYDEFRIAIEANQTVGVLLETEGESFIYAWLPGGEERGAGEEVGDAEGILVFAPTDGTIRIRVNAFPTGGGRPYTVRVRDFTEQRDELPQAHHSDIVFDRFATAALAGWATGSFSEEHASALISYAETLPFYRYFARAAAVYDSLLSGASFPIGATRRAEVLVLAGAMYDGLEQYATALDRFRTVLARSEELKATEADLLDSYAGIGDVYAATSRYFDAAEAYGEAVHLAGQSSGDDSDQADRLRGLQANMLFSLGDYAAAEPLYLRLTELISIADGHRRFQRLHRLADIYLATGRFRDAAITARRSAELYAKSEGTTAPGYLGSRAVEAWALVELGEFSRAIEILNAIEPVLLATVEAEAPTQPDGTGGGSHETGEVLDSAFGSVRRARRLEHAGVLFTRAWAQLGLGELDPAAQDAADSLAIEAELRGPAHPNIAPNHELSGRIALERGDIETAADHLEASREIIDSALGSDHPSLSAPLTQLARLARRRNDASRAISLHGEALDIAQQTARRLLPSMSETHRSAYLRDIDSTFTEFYRSTRAFSMETERIPENLYDALLFRKGIILQSVQRMQQRIEESDDSGLIADFERWRALSEQIANLSEVDAEELSDRGIGLAALREEADQLEGELARRSAVYRRERATDDATWRDVQPLLRSSEAAVELVRFMDNSEPVYGAVILTSDAPPQVIFLDDGAGIEGEAYNAYRAWITALEAGADSYEYFQLTRRWGGAGLPLLHELLYDRLWAGIDDALGGETEVVYLSPDGVYNLVNLSIIETPDGESLAQARALRLVTSTRRLIEERGGDGRNGVGRDPDGRDRGNGRGDGALLAGDPTYRLSPEAAEPLEVNYVAPLYRSAGRLAPLPGTAEVSEIGAQMLAAGITPTELLGHEASETEIKRGVAAPAVLHLATHGFFLDGENATSDPLQNGGLYFAGAQDVLDYGGPLPNQEDDGVFTAREASLLDLRGTELVVLSACETGLGEIRSGEGVYGLLRGFQAAGARSMIVSRWKVADEATSVFMQEFYERWLSGIALRDAFESAREELRRRPEYANPFFWGAFELVDGV